MAMLFLLLGLIVFVLIGVQLTFGIGMSSIVYLFLNSPNLLKMLPQRVWSGTFSFIMIAMPLFMLAGELMNSGGITNRIMDFSLYLVRPIGGDMGEVNVVASMIFGGISGSSVADTAALGSIEIPAMEERGYPSRFAAGITVASSTMGMIIPPSIPMIVYAMISGESVGGLFVAGLIPGILIGLSQLTMVSVISRRKGFLPDKEPFVFKDFLHTMINGLPAILMPAVIFYSVVGGVCTASESAGIAVFYALIVGFFFYKELTIEKVIKALRNTLISSSSIMLIIGYCMVFTWILTISGIPSQIGDFFLNLNMPIWATLLLFDLLILLLGTFIDVTPCILLITPILLPIMINIGVSPLQFGAMLITGMAIGLVTPPVGMCLNACTKINSMPIMEIFLGAAPFIMCNIVVFLLITFVPFLTTWLPSILNL